MNKPTSLFFALIGILSFTPAAAHAVTVAEARQGITTAINKRLAARHHRDAAAYLSTFEPTWTRTNVSGETQTYAAMRKTMIKRLANLPISEMYKIHWRMTKVTVSGSETHATLVAQYEYPVRRTPKGPVYVYIDIVSDSVWGRTPGGWVQRSEKIFYDSKAFSTRALATGERGGPGL